MLSRTLIRCTTCDRETVIVSSGGPASFNRVLARSRWTAGAPLPGTTVGSLTGQCPTHGGGA